MKILFGEKCIGCGACTKQCPEVFGFDREKRRAFVRPDAAVEALLKNELEYHEDATCDHHGEHHHEGGCGDHDCGGHSCGDH